MGAWSHRLRKYPILALLAVSPFGFDGAVTFRMLGPQLFIHFIHPAPLPFPVDMSRAFDLTHPMLVFTLDQLRQVQRQHAIVERIISFRELSLALNLAHTRPSAVRGRCGKPTGVAWWKNLLTSRFSTASISL